jgi:hypothetical protein
MGAAFFIEKTLQRNPKFKHLIGSLKTLNRGFYPKSGHHLYK